MITNNADEILFRASSMSDIMTGVAKKWDVENSLTTKRKLVQIFRELQWHRKSRKSNKYTEKGIEVEEDSISLYSRFKKDLFTKNTERINNAFFTGEVDLFKGKDILNAELIIDIKSSWDWTTFPSLLDVESKDYYAQAQTYMCLTNAEKAVIAHCLVNTPAEQIMDEMKKLQWKMQTLDPDNNEEYKEECRKIEQDKIVDRALFEKHYPYYDFLTPKEEWIYDIPMEERVHEVVIYRDEAYIQLMISRVIECRQWMNKYLFKV